MAAELARVAVAVAFALAALAKLRDRTGFTRTLALSPVTRRRRRELSLAVPAVELVAAAGLVIPRLWPGGAVAAAGLLGGFTAFLQLTRHLDAAGGCRCFGTPGASRRSGTIRNLVLLAVLAVGSGWWMLTAAAGYAAFAGCARVARSHRPVGPAGGFRPGGTSRPESGELMLVFVEAGCRSCHDLLAELPRWPAADGVTLRVVDDAHLLDAHGVTATPSAVVLDAAGRAVDGNHRPGAVPAVGRAAIERRWQLAVQGHDLPLPPGAERTLLLFVDRDDAVPEIGPGKVVVLTSRRLRRPPASVPVRHDPGGAVRALFDVKHTPAAVLVDRRGAPLGPVTTGPALATLLQPSQP